ncbi:oxygen-independent coproporphyrinogen III oxidase [Afifella sp. IM 167]|uniref:oxygen-independent coproporphyrinogen III oxidase n=1 Tax=Afifella sp. IM 167 TaxID=2033586 RepID=UPI001CCA9D31|nr:oxygen-independent coproporphyrinogen III oxidase [Afifella sp. IM 167]MBZ8133843.1 oxygen-independent coproporphyrinogen III oxidase [Afifella sp. IM 167]
MVPDLVHKYSSPVPRYTSYPTAPHFTDEVDGDIARAWLTELKPGTSASLYLHIPFCDTLCWFCGCTTRHVLRYDPIKPYLKTLQAELKLVAEFAPDLKVEKVHWGGGSPTLLRPDDIVGLAGMVRDAFPSAADAEFSVEIDPREFDDERVAAIGEAGFTRASIGVQDFSKKVQTTINRMQSFEETKSAADRLRAVGITSINVDLVYGLPFQTRANLISTVKKILQLKPDRVALFGYAHVPNVIPRQKMIPTDALPDVLERFAQANRAATLFTGAGYQRIGFDHFALPEDSLAVAAWEGRLHRNFQGYTNDQAEALIGFGASSISQLPQGYLQNEKTNRRYTAAVEEGKLATVRGFKLSNADRVRAFVIERLLCDFAFSGAALKSRFGALADPVINDARYFAEADPDGLFTRVGDRFVVTDRGRPFVRSIAASFDAYFGTRAATHSTAV